MSTPTVSVDSGPAKRSRRELIRYAVLFVTLMACYGYFVQGLGPNELSRYDLVRAVVDDHTLSIDRYRDNTMDKAFANGHYYSDKAFGLSFMAMPVYAAVRAIDQVRSAEQRNDFGMVYFLVLFTVALPSAVTVVLLARLAKQLVPDGSPFFAALVYGLGTIAFPFATSFFGHQTAAFLGFSAACLAIHARLAKKGPAWSLAAGVLAGITAVVEYPAAIITGLLFFYILLATRDWRHVGAFIAGVVPAILMLATYNYLAFGNPISISYGFVNDPAFAAGRRGIMGVTLPDLDTALTVLFGGRGLLINAPIFLLAPIGAFKIWRANRARPELLLCVAVFAGFFLYNAGFWLPFGGMSPGPRFLLPAFPFLALLLAATLGKHSEQKVFAWALAGWGMLVMTTATITAPLVTEDKSYPLIQTWVPQLLRQEFTYNLGKWVLHLDGMPSVAPFFAAMAIGLLAIWLLREPKVDLESQTLRDQDACPSQT